MNKNIILAKRLIFLANQIVADSSLLKKVRPGDVRDYQGTDYDVTAQAASLKLLDDAGIVVCKGRNSYSNIVLYSRQNGKTADSVKKTRYKVDSMVLPQQMPSHEIPVGDMELDKKLVLQQIQPEMDLFIEHHLTAHRFDIFESAKHIWRIAYLLAVADPKSQSSALRDKVRNYITSKMPNAEIPYLEPYLDIIDYWANKLRPMLIKASELAKGIKDSVKNPMTETAWDAAHEMVSKKDGTCVNCEKPIKAGTLIRWNKDTFQAAHVDCENPNKTKVKKSFSPPTYKPGKWVQEDYEGERYD